MWRPLSKTFVWQHILTGWVLLGASVTGSADIYRAYVGHQRQHYKIDHAHWDWTVPDDWYRQANS